VTSQREGVALAFSRKRGIPLVAGGSRELHQSLGWSSRGRQRPHEEVLERAQPSLFALRDHALAAVAERVRRPGTDLLSALIGAADAGDAHARRAVRSGAGADQGIEFQQNIAMLLFGVPLASGDSRAS
jgi:hypothetical protein